MLSYGNKQHEMQEFGDGIGIPKFCAAQKEAVEEAIKKYFSANISTVDSEDIMRIYICFQYDITLVEKIIVDKLDVKISIEPMGAGTYYLMFKRHGAHNQDHIGYEITGLFQRCNIPFVNVVILRNRILVRNDGIPSSDFPGHYYRLDLKFALAVRGRQM